MTREEEAARALGSTRVSAAWAWVLTIGFLGPIAAAPALQLAVEKRREPARTPSAFRTAGLLPTRAEIAAVRTPVDAVTLLARAPAIRAYETRLEDASIITEWVLPHAQAALLRAGAGNEKAYCGVGGWLFYRPDVDYVTGPGFLRPDALQARRREGDGDPVAPDPLPAVTRFHRQLAQRGIRLVVMPVPPKPVIHPDRLAPGARAGALGLQNPSYAAFVEALRREGVAVADPTPALASEAQTRGPRFLRTDTHWTPEAMQAAARAAADAVRACATLPPAGTAAFTARRGPVRGVGDIARMLRLPEDHPACAPQEVTVARVLQPDGTPWRPLREADVLLLGDSYANIYSAGSLGWGSGGGLGEHLSLLLQRPIDRIAIDDGGSHATRAQLARELARGRDRLAGKRVVVWEFAMRNLAQGDWKAIDLAPAPPSSPKGAAP